MTDPTSPKPVLALLVVIEDRNTWPGEGAEVKLRIDARPVYLSDPGSEEPIEIPNHWSHCNQTLCDLHQYTRTASKDPAGWITTEHVYDLRRELNTHQIKPMAAELARIDRAWSKKWETDGSADSAGEFVLRFARIMGAKAIFMPSSARRLKVTGQKYEGFTPAEGKGEINRQIQTLFSPAPDFVSA